MINVFTIYDTIMAGMVVRTREELKCFERLIDKRIHLALMDTDDFEELFHSKVKKHLDCKAKLLADFIINSCRFTTELTEEETEVLIEITLDEYRRVSLIPRNFFSAIIARCIQFNEMAHDLNHAFETARKHLFPVAKEAEKEVKNDTEV